MSEPDDIGNTPRCPIGPRQYYNISTLLTRRRVALSLTQAEVAANIPCSRARVNKWEGGLERPGGEHLCSWAAVLGVELVPVIRLNPPAPGRDHKK